MQISQGRYYRLIWPKLSADELYISTSDNSQLFEISPFKVGEISAKDLAKFEAFESVDPSSLMVPTLIRDKMNIPGTVSNQALIIVEVSVSF